MQIGQLPLDTWIVIEHPTLNGVALVSQHASQSEAEAERDRRNRATRAKRFSACIVVEPVAERMGGQRRCCAWQQ
jgi:hypothetical protein